MILNSVIDDKSRCRLSIIPGEAGSDYINASHIKVSQISFIPNWMCTMSVFILIYPHNPCLFSNFHTLLFRATTREMPSLPHKGLFLILQMISGE